MRIHLRLLLTTILLLGGLVASEVLGRRQESRLASGNDLSHFEAKSLSRVKIMVWIRYRYSGDHGASNIYVAASALNSDGSQQPDTVYGVAPIKIGESTASVEITKRHGKDLGVSERVRVCLQEGAAGKPFYCETFPFVHSWSENGAGELPVRNEIGGFRVDPISSKEEIRVQVNYAYTGDRGKNDIQMIAFWFRGNGARAADTEGIPLKIEPGYGRAALKIRKGPAYTPEPSYRLRVCMMPPDGRTFACEEFPKY